MTAPDATLPPEAITRAWKAAVTAVQCGRVTTKVVTALEKLVVLDPKYPAGHLLTGIAHAQLDHFREASFHLTLASHGIYKDEAERNLAELSARAQRLDDASPPLD